MPGQVASAMSRGVGTVKAMEAAIRGLDGVFRTLARQHAEASALLRSAVSTEDISRRNGIWEGVRSDLLSHEGAELREIYSVLEEYAELQPLAREHAKDAEAMEELIEQIDLLDEADPEWPILLGDLIKMVEQHAYEEEREIFPKAQEVLGIMRAAELERPFLAAKERVMNEIAGS